MAHHTLKELAEKMADIDFAMLLAHTEGGAIAGRPMSNNGDVEYDGDSFFFVWKETRTVSDITRDSKVTLSMQDKSGLLGKPPLMIALEGEAQLVRDKAQFVTGRKSSTKSSSVGTQFFKANRDDAAVTTPSAGWECACTLVSRDAESKLVLLGDRITWKSNSSFRCRLQR